MSILNRSGGMYDMVKLHLAESYSYPLLSCGRWKCWTWKWRTISIFSQPVIICTSYRIGVEDAGFEASMSTSL